MSKKDESNRSTIETITPLTAPTLKSRGAGTHSPNRQHRIIIFALIGSLVLLVSGGGWLLHYLSKNPIQPGRLTPPGSPRPADVKKESAKAPQKQPAPEAEPGQLAREKEAAEQRLADLLAARKNLDDKGVADWGEAAYTEMIKWVETADSAFVNKDYKTAARQYAQATAIAENLAGRSAGVLTRLLDEGQAALDAGDGPLAQLKFSTALRIDSANQAARRGQQRAKTIDAVKRLIATGREHETDGDLSLAADNFHNALQLDAHSQEARIALESVNRRIKEAQFQLLISEGMAAFQNHDYRIARSKLSRARALKPNSPEVRDALLQVDQAERLARIAAMQKQALAAEQREDWQRALKSYQAVLDIDRNVQFASRGKNRAAEQIRIAKRIDFYLAKPDILGSDNHLKNAILLISDAGEIDPRGPQLAARIEKLEELVTIAKTPVKITITSDNLTDVAVYRVGKLGRFHVHELELRPGTYTVVGSRDGYQDVRQKVVVEPDRLPIRITIECKVKI
jgi:hypothetical protein